MTLFAGLIWIEHARKAMQCLRGRQSFGLDPAKTGAPTIVFEVLCDQ
jgi:hypothetical protein